MTCDFSGDVSFDWSGTTTENVSLTGSEIASESDVDHVSARMKSSLVAHSDEYLTRAGQFGGNAPSSMYATVENLSSYTTWYCGVTHPVRGLKTSATLLAWNGECPRYTPIIERGSHFCGLAPPADLRRLSRTSTGENIVWKVFTGIFSTSVPYRIDSGVYPSILTCKVLSISAMYLNANGQNIWSILCGHIFIPCKRSVLAPSVKILFLCSTMKFWWWVPTPQNVIFWSFELTADRNPLSANLPLSVW